MGREASMSGWALQNWPFFEPAHRDLAAALAGWTAVEHEEDADFEPVCRGIATSLAEHGFLDLVVPQGGDGRVDLRAVCIARDALAYQSVLADTVFVMQGIGSSAIRMHGTPDQQARYLERVRTGRAIAGFALTEPDSGSDVANLTTTATLAGNHYLLNGTKAYISNAPFADHYIVVARTGEAPGARGLSVFIVEAGTPGLEAGAPVALMAPHPVGPLYFKDCRVPAENMIGEPGRGFAVAMATFDIYRTSVGAAAVGMARRALHETVERVKSRRLFGGSMAELAGVQARLADMAVDLETAALSVYAAAWTKDVTGGRCSREASMAKLVGSEHAQRVIDGAVQIFGGMGVTRGSIVERLYREVRATRIYEGASEVQKLVIARSILSERG